MTATKEGGKKKGCSASASISLLYQTSY